MDANQFLLFCLSSIDDAAEKTKFEKIYYAHRHAMLYTAQQILRDQHLAEDAVQEAFLRITKHLHKINVDDCHKTKAFVVIIVKNIAINMYNKRKKTAEVFLFEEVVENAISVDLSGEDNDIAKIVQAMKRLPEIYAHIMMLRYLHDLNDKACAQLLNVSEAAVRKRLERGRALLKNELEKESE